MQFHDFLKRNGLSLDEVARAWGMDKSTVSRAAGGKRWPSDKIMINAFRLSNGQVGFLDWIETNRPALVAAGLITETEFPHGKKTPGKPGRPRTRGRGRRRQESVQDAAA